MFVHLTYHKPTRRTLINGTPTLRLLKSGLFAYSIVHKRKRRTKTGRQIKKPGKGGWLRPERGFAKRRRHQDPHRNKRHKSERRKSAAR
ncbi:hypothetical protein GWI33_004551 [Rhynchophorus ferrugineus]|uniref:Uncharacterized protein n=1 Tax=Rhynchophorus ferrugineus TaxID=354439 RepID=A0A834IP92_RHYFE|nr:hypothetical protein GWI33_004551 [Rhynchophorus ferrugineus]